MQKCVYTHVTEVYIYMYVAEVCVCNPVLKNKKTKYNKNLELSTFLSQQLLFNITLRYSMSNILRNTNKSHLFKTLLTENNLFWDEYI